MTSPTGPGFNAVVRFTPDFTGFKTSYNNFLATLNNSVKVDVKIGTVTGFTSAMNDAARVYNALSDSARFSAKIGRVTGLAAALRTAAAGASINVGVNVNAASIRAALAASGPHSVTVHVNYVQGAIPNPPNIGPITGAGGSNLSGTLNSLGGRGNAGTGALVALGLSAITPLTTTLLSLSSALAVTGAGVAAFSGAAVGHLAQVTDVMKQIKEEGRQLYSLPEPFQRLIPVVDQFRHTYGLFLQDTRGPVFDVFISSMQIAEGLLTRLTPVVNSVAGGIKSALGSVGEVLGSGPTGQALTGFLDIVKTEAPQAIQTLTRTVLNFGSGFLNVFTAAAPAGFKLFDVLEGMSQRFLTFTASLQGSTALQHFFDYATEYGPKILGIFESLTVLVFHLVEALAPVGALVVDVLSGFLKLASAISPENWQRLAVAVGAVYVGFKSFAILTSIVSSFTAFRAILPGIIAILSNLVPTIRGLVAALRVWAAANITLEASIPIIGAVLVAISLLAVAFSTLGSSSKKTSQDIEGQKEIIDALTESYLKNAGAADEASKKTIFGRAFDAGIFQPGVDPNKAVSGLAGDKDAYNETKAQLDRIAAARKKALDDFNNNPLTRHDPNRPNPKAEVERKRLQDEANQSQGQAAWYTEHGTDAEKAASKADLERAAGLGTLGGALVDTTSLLDKWASAQARAAGTGTPEGTIAKGLVDAYKSETDALRSLTDAKYNEGQVAKSTAEANVQALRSVKDAQHSYAEAQLSTKQAVDALAKARVDAAKALEEQGDKEQSALIAMQRAQREAYALGLYKGPVVSEEQIKIEETQTGLSTATRAYNNTTAEGAILRANGIENAPGVLSARKNLADAQYNEGKSRQSVADAENNYTKALSDGEHQRSVAHQQTVDANTAYQQAKTYVSNLVDEMITSLFPNIEKGSTQWQALHDKFATALTMDATDPIAKLTAMTSLMATLVTWAANPTLTFDEAAKKATADLTKSTSLPNGVSLGSLLHDDNTAHHAVGGPIYGPGTWTSDSVPAMLSHGEYVLRAAAVDKIGLPYLNQLNHADKYADGGFASRGNQSQDEKQAAGANTGSPSTYQDSSVLGSGVFKADPDGWPAAVLNTFSPNTRAAQSFIKSHWPNQQSNPDYMRTGDPGSDHPLGKALDNATEASTKEGLARGNEIANWFTANPNAFGTKYVIWNRHIADGRKGNGWSGPRAFGTVGDREHIHHVHVSFVSGDGSKPLASYGGTLGGGNTGSGSGSDTSTTPTGLSDAQYSSVLDPLTNFLAGSLFAPLGAKVFKDLKSSLTSTTVASTGSVPGGSSGGGQKITIGASTYGPPGADPGVTTDGGKYGHLSGKMAYAELSNNPKAKDFAALGNLPGHQKAHITYKGKTVDAEKLDVGGGGGDISGHHRSIDLWYELANALGFSGTGLVDFQTFKNGGAVLADNGAVLPPRSATMVVNGTNQPEQVGFGFTDAQLRKLAVLIAQAVQTRPNELYIDGEVINDRAKEAISKNLRIPGL